MNLPDVVDGGLCTGCGGCVSALSRNPGDAMPRSMKMTEDGYLRPEPALPLPPAEQRIFESVCAGARIDGKAAEPDYHPLWGPIRRLATGYATDPEVRYRGSSGGVLTALAIGLVEAGEVEFVLSSSADNDDPVGNRTAPRTDRAAMLQAAGSRYGPSSPLAGLEAHLQAGRKFAFIGKPCDVATVARMAKQDPRIGELIPYRFAFFCAGVPSRLGTLAVLDALGVSYEDLFRFQYRGDGWPGLARATRRDGSEESMDYNSSWGTILNRYLQQRCKVCPDGTGEFADIACADAWYGKDGYPDFTERDGRSLIVARSEAGERLLARLEQAGLISTEPLDVDEIERMQPYQVNRKRNVLSRSTGTQLAGGKAGRFRRLALLSLLLSDEPENQLRNAFGAFKRSRAKAKR
jgi:coenzyme F420 hydrogenase subunit beta